MLSKNRGNFYCKMASSFANPTTRLTAVRLSHPARVIKKATATDHQQCKESPKFPRCPSGEGEGMALLGWPKPAMTPEQRTRGDTDDVFCLALTRRGSCVRNISLVISRLHRRLVSEDVNFCRNKLNGYQGTLKKKTAAK